MVWGAIRFGWRSNLVIADGTLTSQRYIMKFCPRKLSRSSETMEMTFSCKTMHAHMSRGHHQRTWEPAMYRFWIGQPIHQR